MRADQIALELYSVRDATKDDMIGTLRKVADMGYRALEFAGYGNSNVREVRAALDDLGLKAAAAHIALARFEASVAEVIDDTKALGAEYAIVPSVPQELRGQVAAVQRLAEQFNSYGEQCRAAGLQFGYHNHNFEFAPLDGTTFYDVLLKGTDPGLVKLELDVYWALFAEHDPVELIRRNAGRVALLHVKDMAAGADRDMAVPGEGIIEWGPMLDAADAAGTQWYVIEHDRPKDPLNDVERALRYLETQAK